MPIVGETWDGWLSDINGMHVQPEHVFQALDSAKDGPFLKDVLGAVQEWYAMILKAVLALVRE